MILLDTNVISEMMRPTPAAAVESWMREQPVASLFISSITEAELRYGVALLPEGQRRRNLLLQVEAMLAEDFVGRILPFDSSAATAYAQIAAMRRQAGRSIAQADAQIASIAAARGAAVATRNVVDFEGCGISILNPWTL